MKATILILTLVAGLTGCERGSMSTLDAAYRWTVTWPTSGVGDHDAAATTVAASGAGGVLVGGRFTGTIDMKSAAAMPTTDLPLGLAAQLSPEGASDWARPLAGPALGVQPAPDGGVFVVGWYSHREGFDAWPAPQGVDGYVARLDPSGALIWVRTVSGAEYDELVAVAPIAGGTDVYVLGRFEKEADVSFSATTPDARKATSALQPELLLARLDAAGNRVWARPLGPGRPRAAGATGEGVVALAEVLGDGSPRDFNPGGVPDPHPVPAAGSRAVISLGPDGEYRWTRLLGLGESAASALAVTADAIYVAGTSWQPFDFGGAAGPADVHAPSGAGAGQLFVSGLRQDGSTAWTSTFGGDVGYAQALAMASTETWPVALWGSFPDAAPRTRYDLVLLDPQGRGTRAATDLASLPRAITAVPDGVVYVGNTPGGDLDPGPSSDVHTDAYAAFVTRLAWRK